MSSLKVLHFSPKEVEIQLIFLCKGEVEKVVESVGKPVIVMGQPLTAGQYFGQLGLLSRSVRVQSAQARHCPNCLYRDERRTCSMRARGLSELRYIRRADFYEKVCP